MPLRQFRARVRMLTILYYGQQIARPRLWPVPVSVRARRRPSVQGHGWGAGGRHVGEAALPAGEGGAAAVCGRRRGGRGGWRGGGGRRARRGRDRWSGASVRRDKLQAEGRNECAEGGVQEH